MSDQLEKTLTGEPATITIGGATRRLEYRFAAVLAYQQQTSDSLFDPQAYQKIDLTRDPKRWLACLWAGLHEKQKDGTWKPGVSLEQLEDEIDLDPVKAGEISRTMVRALAAYFPKAEPAKTPAPATTDETPAPSRPSSSSGPAPGGATGSVAVTS